MPLYYYDPYVSGVSIFAKAVAEGLVADGYEVTVLTSRHEKDLPKREVINGVQVIRRPVLFKLGKGVIMPTFWLDMVRYAFKHDYVNAHLPLAEAGLAALFIPKRKQVTTYQCDIFLGNGLIDRFVTFVSLSLMRVQLWRSRAIASITLDYIQHSKMKRFSGKAHATYAPIVAENFTSADAAPLFKQLKIPTEALKIGFMGRIVYEKGINYLLEAIPHLQKELPNFNIVIAGDYEKVAGGSIKAELDKFLEQYPGVIVFTGYLSDADRNKLYSGIDVLVLPSIDPLEAFGMVQVEAMLCGTPVVASDLPGVREVVRKTGYGKISKIKDSADIARQITEVLKNPTKYKPDRQKVMAYFNQQDAIDAYEKLMP
jgi:glycosyltransferase involved in cell wall biosynthesis